MGMSSMAPLPPVGVPPYLSIRIPLDERPLMDEVISPLTKSTSTLTLKSMRIPALSDDLIKGAFKPTLGRSNTAPITPSRKTFRVSRKTESSTVPPYLSLRIPRDERPEEPEFTTKTTQSATTLNPPSFPSSKAAAIAFIRPSASLTGTDSGMPPYLGLRIPLDERSPPPGPAKFKRKISEDGKSAMSAPPGQAPWLKTSSAFDTTTEDEERTPEKIDIETRLARTKSIGLPRNPKPGQPIPRRKWSADDDIPPVPTVSRSTSRSTVERARSQREPRRKLGVRDDEGLPRRRPSTRDGEERLRRRPSTRDGEEELRRRPSTRGSDQSSRRKDGSTEGPRRRRGNSKLRQLSYPDEDSERSVFKASSVKKAGLTVKTELSPNDDSPRTPGSYFSPKTSIVKSPSEESVSLAFVATIEKTSDLPSSLRLSKSIDGDGQKRDDIEASEPAPTHPMETLSKDNQHQHTDSDSTISASHTSAWSSYSSMSSTSSPPASTQPLSTHLLNLPTTANKLLSATNSPFTLPSDPKPMSDEMQILANKALRKYMIQERAYLCAEMRFLGLLLANVELPRQKRSLGGVGASLSGKVVDFLMRRVCAVGARLEVVDGVAEDLSTSFNNDNNNNNDDEEEEVSDSDGVKMFKSLFEAMGREIEGCKKSVLVGLVIIWAREKAHLDSSIAIKYSIDPLIPKPAKDTAQDLITRKLVPGFTAKVSLAMHEELGGLMDEIWAQGKEKGFVERRDGIARKKGGMREEMSVEGIFGLVLDIQGKVWGDLG